MLENLCPISCKNFKIVLKWGCFIIYIWFELELFEEVEERLLPVDLDELPDVFLSDS